MARGGADHRARLLAAAGVGRGDHVGFLLGPGLDLLETMFAIAKAGAVIVPINERFRAAELRQLIGHSEIVALVTTSETSRDLDFLGRLREAFPDLGDLRVLLTDDAEVDGCVPLASLEPRAAGNAEQVALAREGVSVADNAFVMYTSGTSAEPKGCMLTHEAYTREGQGIARTRYLLEAGDTFWCPLPLFHNGAIATLFACLGVGANYCHSGRFDPEVALSQLEDERCTHAIPTFETIWLRVLDLPRFPRADLSALRVLLNAGSPTRLRQLQERVPQAIQLSNYGSTEATGHLTMTELTDPPELRFETCGRPLPGMELKVVDPESGESVATGARGEICFRGPLRFRGYYKAPETSAAVIDAEGWFHSGDLGSLDDAGRVSFHGRIKDMLKVGGENVAAAEVEAFLLRHPAVSIAQVVGAPDAHYTEVPAAFVELVPGASVTEQELIDFCLGDIATFKVPRYVRFVEEWPMSGTKIKKFVLRDRIHVELEAAGVTEAPRIRA